MFLLNILVIFLRLLRFVADKLSDIIYAILYENSKSCKLPPITDAILLMPATTLASKIRAQELSSVLVVSAFINRIKSVNDTINAVVDQRFLQAMKEAKEADKVVKGRDEYFGQ